MTLDQETDVEISARKSNHCPACNKAKEQSSLVCWDCFKHRRDITPLKYYDGSFTQWLLLAKKGA